MFAALPGSILMAPYGHLSWQTPHLAVLLRHLDSSITEIIGSIFHLGLLITVAALDAAPLPWETLAGMDCRARSAGQATESTGGNRNTAG
jgi:hypothetical protein